MQREIAATFDFPDHPSWGEQVEVLQPQGLSRRQWFRRLLEAAQRCKVLMLDGSERGYRDIAFAPFLSRLRRPPQLILTDCTWKLGSMWLDRLACRTMVRLIDSQNVSYCVLSTGERKIFPKTWGVDPRRIFFTPWAHFLSAKELAEPVSEAGDIFAGGDSLRDYGPLIAAARDLPASLTIASRSFSASGASLLPPNVQAMPVSPERYNDLSRQARAVVIPLEERQDRSAGQFTYLSAMAMGKAVIVTDVLGVRDYVEHRRTGLIVPPGDPGAMRSALLWLLDPAHLVEVRQMQARAREVVRARFGPKQHIDSLLRVAQIRLN